jgi:hypothetical protein
MSQKTKHDYVVRVNILFLTLITSLVVLQMPFEGNTFSIHDYIHFECNHRKHA